MDLTLGYKTVQLYEAFLIHNALCGHVGSPMEDASRLDHKARRVHFTYKHSSGENLHPVGAANVAIDLSCHCNNGGFDFSLYARAVPHNELLLAAHRPFYFALNSERPSQFKRPFQSIHLVQETN